MILFDETFLAGIQPRRQGRVTCAFRQCAMETVKVQPFRSAFVKWIWSGELSDTELNGNKWRKNNNTSLDSSMQRGMCYFRDFARGLYWEAHFIMHRVGWVAAFCSSPDETCTPAQTHDGMQTVLWKWVATRRGIEVLRDRSTEQKKWRQCNAFWKEYAIKRA